MNIVHFKEINSTNTYLKENYQKYPNLTVVTADHQTDGKGRTGRRWVSGDDLLFSILIKEKIDDPTKYSLLIASVIWKVLSQYTEVKIKWPNDIMIDDYKVAGILLEAVTKENIECVVIGCGININTKSFPDDLVMKASSLYLKLGKKIDKKIVLDKIIDTFQNDYNNFNCYNLDIIRENFYLQNKNVTFVYDGETKTGVVQGMDDDGNIIISTKKNVYHLNSGEVSFHNSYKK